MRICAALTFTLACPTLILASAPRVDRDPALEVGSFVMSSYSALSANGSIYECEIIAKQTRGDAQSGERGSARLRIARTIYGTQRSEIIVPYYTCGGFTTHPDAFLPWCDDTDRPLGLRPDSAVGTRLCVLFIPKAWSGLINSAAESDGAISDLDILSRDDDPKLAAWFQIAELHSIRSEATLKQKLTEALSSDSSRVRRYARLALVAKLAGERPAEVVNILCQWIGNARGGDAKVLRDERREALEVVGSFTRSNGHPEATEGFAIDALLKLARSSSLTVRDDALFELARVVDPWRRANKTPTADGLSASQRTLLRQAVDALAAEPPGVWPDPSQKGRTVAAIRAWLAAAKPPPPNRAYQAVRYLMGGGLLAACLFLLARYEYLRRLRRARRLKGLCAFCGYDLRASGEKCPECGHRIPLGT